VVLFDTFAVEGAASHQRCWGHEFGGFEVADGARQRRALT
jgi:hypothetical protein